MRQETLNHLLALATQSFEGQISADAFAKAAAHKAACDAASIYCADAADSAATLACVAFFSEATAAMHYSAAMADVSTESSEAKRRYQTHRYSFLNNTMPTFRALSPTMLFQKPIASTMTSTAPLGNALLQQYQQIFIYDELGSEKARRAALSVYADCYTSMRAAYIRASYVATQEKESNTQRTVFSDVMKGKLWQELSYDMLFPSFIIKCLHHRNTKMCTLLLLLASAAAIVVAHFSVLGAPFLPWLIAGITAAVLGICLLFASLYAYYAIKHIQKANESTELRRISSPN